MRRARPNPYAPFREECTRRWSSITPFRLGMVIGSAGEPLICPYPGKAAARAFEQGRIRGIRSPLRRLSDG
ncbi:hypothetical protein [Sphingobium lignivorans]|uniref:Uncharacterized protein n=1 Tax=Sphingobium lignivorans TaxID=2735886 RepID=A0ABR6NJE4_9SPHN|nr:hypothetical protein [Sphingobium lignivorans]MBB5987404.1 hypothetical protein [Sphingobium lignivorans]